MINYLKSFPKLIAIFLLGIISTPTSHGQQSSTKKSAVIPANVRSTFVKFRELETKPNYEQLLDLYCDSAVIVLLDKEQQELKLNKEHLKDLQQYLQPHGQKDQKSSPHNSPISYESITFSKVPDSPSHAVKGIRKNRSTFYSAPFYLEIEDGKIVHHAWEPVMELDLTGLKEDAKLSALFSNTAFDTGDQDPLPSMGPNNLMQDPPPTFPDNKEKIHALRVLSQEPPDILGKKFLEYLIKKHKDSTIDLLDSFTPKVSGSKIDPRNTYALFFIKTSPNQDTNKVFAIGCKMVKVNPEHPEVLILYKLSPLPQAKDGSIKGNDILKINTDLLEDLHLIDPTTLEFE